MLVKAWGGLRWLGETLGGLGRLKKGSWFGSWLDVGRLGVAGAWPSHHYLALYYDDLDFGYASIAPKFGRLEKAWGDLRWLGALICLPFTLTFCLFHFTSDTATLKNFIKNGLTLQYFTPDEGMRLAVQVRQTVDYLEEINKYSLVKEKSTTDSGFLSRDKFLKQFLSMYMDESLGKKGPLKSSLIMSLLKVFVAKANGH